MLQSIWCLNPVRYSHGGKHDAQVRLDRVASAVVDRSNKSASFWRRRWTESRDAIGSRFTGVTLWRSVKIHLMAQSTHPMTIDTVQRYWDARPCNIRHSDKPVGTREYFEEVEKRKYFVEPHIPSFAEFPTLGPQARPRDRLRHRHRHHQLRARGRRGHGGRAALRNCLPWPPSGPKCSACRNASALCAPTPSGSTLRQSPSPSTWCTPSESFTIPRARSAPWRRSAASWRQAPNFA